MAHRGRAHVRGRLTANGPCLGVQGHGKQAPTPMPDQSSPQAQRLPLPVRPAAVTSILTWGYAADFTAPVARSQNDPESGRFPLSSV